MSRNYSAENEAIGRTILAVIVIVIIIIAGAAAFYFSQTATSSTTTSSSSSVATSSASSSLSSSSTTSSSVSTSSSASSSLASSSSSSSSSTSAQTTSSSSSSSSSTSAPQTLGIDSWSWPFPNDLNVLVSNYSPWPEWQYQTVYQTLVNTNETGLLHTGNIQYLPGLAQNWSVSADAQTYTFNLRHNVTFSNGDPFNAYQVWMEFYGVYYLSYNSSSWLNNYNLFNYTGVNFGPVTIAQINQSGLISPSAQALAIMQNSSWPIYANGPYQLVLHLSGPFLWLPGTLLSYGGLLYDAQYVLNNGGFGTPTSPNTSFNLKPIPGTGPYVVTGVQEQAYVQFGQNPKYWGLSLTPAEIAQDPILDPGHVKNVIVYAKTDDLARYSDLSSGTVQIADIQPSDWSLITSNPQEFSYLSLPSWNGLISTLGLNTQVYPTNITLVRQAIVHAINYTNLYATAYGGNMTSFMGPEYPAWNQFYDLGNFKPYQYNLTLAKQDLAQANITNMPTFTLRIETGCQACVSAASIVQADLGQIGITVNIEVLTGSTYLSVYGGYSYNMQNAQQIGQLSWVDGGEGWGAFALTPADYWFAFVNNQSVWGNWAIYSNPVVQKCVNAFSQTTNVTAIQSLCTAAQQQIYNDAPYAWIGVFGLWLPTGGSTVWNNHVIKSGFLIDPTWGGQSSLPIFNTVQFVG